MNEQRRLENRLKSIEERLDKTSEILILLCEINTQTNASDIKKRNQQSTLKRLASHLEGLQRRA